MAAARKRQGRRGKGPSFLMFLLLTAVLGFVAGYFLFFTPDRSARAPKGVSEPPAPGDAGKQAAPVPRPKASPRVAVIIDDIGMNMAPLDRIGAMPVPVAVAVLPMLRHSEEAALEARKAGVEVLLHLPMQPDGDSLKGLGPGALLSGMTGEELRKGVEEGLQSVPGAVGVNNHMGSALTGDREAMGAVMAELRKRGLYFVDSRTTSVTVALDAARENGVRAAGRDVFLDDIDDPEEIRKQFGRLIRRARRDGTAIAIGHPRQATLDVLAEELPRLKGQGIDVVRVSELVR